MSGQFVYTPYVCHCDFPCERITLDAPTGTLWRCDECKTTYRREFREYARTAGWYRVFWRNLFKGRK